MSLTGEVSGGLLGEEEEEEEEEEHPHVCLPACTSARL
jgi:hypothetical protein